MAAVNIVTTNSTPHHLLKLDVKFDQAEWDVSDKSYGLQDNNSMQTDLLNSVMLLKWYIQR